LEKYSEVVGLPVICMETGKKAGIISDVIFCPEDKSIRAFFIETKGIRNNKKIILKEDILNIGKDALIIRSLSCIKPLKKAGKNAELTNNRINGLKVYTKEGNDLGVVKDILFDANTLKIEGVEVSDGLFQDIIQGRKIVPLFGKVEFSNEFMLVGKEAIEEIIYTGGGLRNKLFKN